MRHRSASTATRTFRAASPTPYTLSRPEHAAERYGVPAHEILQRAGEAGYVGGEEDMLIDLALQLAQERDLAATGAR